MLENIFLAVATVVIIILAGIGAAFLFDLGASGLDERDE
jgi:hypothetical protein